MASQLLIGPTGTMYYRDSGGEIFVLDYDGTPVFGNDQSPGELRGGCYKLAMTPDGTLLTYKRGTDKGLCAIDESGSLLWVFSIPDWGINDVIGPPTVTPNGTVYFVTSNDTLYALWPNGTLKWKRTVQGLGYDAVTTLGRNDEICVRGSKIDVFGPDGTFLWEYEEDHRFVGAIVIGDDGTAYAATWAGTVVALSPEGDLDWSYQMSTGCGGAPAIGPDGTIYIGSHLGLMHALDPEGNLQWTFDTHSNITSSATVSAEGTVYFSCRTEDFFAVRSDGTLKWAFRPNARSYSRLTDFYVNYAEGTAPVIGPDGTIFFGCEGDILYAVGRDFVQGQVIPSIDDGPYDSSWPVLGGGIGNKGYYDEPILVPGPEEVWRYSMPFGSIGGTMTGRLTDPVIGTDGVILLGVDKTLYAVTPGGDPLWTQRLPDSILGGVSVASNGSIYYMCKDGTMQSRDPSGTLRWSMAFVAHRWYHPVALSGGGVLYLTAEDDPDTVGENAHIYAINHDSSIRWRLSIGSDRISAPVVGPDGAIHFTTGMGLLYKVSPQGEIIWVHVFSNEKDSRLYIQSGVTSSSPVVGPEGRVYFTYLNRLHAVGPDGNPLWSFEAEPSEFGLFIGFPHMAAPALRKGGDLILGDERGTLYCLSSEGTQIWAISLDSRIIQQPVVDDNDKIIVITHDTIFAINRDGSMGWNNTYQFFGDFSNPFLSGALTGLAPGGNDTLYLVDTDGNLRALRTEPQEDASGFDPMLLYLILAVIAALVIVFIGISAVIARDRKQSDSGTLRDRKRW